MEYDPLNAAYRRRFLAMISQRWSTHINGSQLGLARILPGNKNCASQTRPGRIISGRWRLRSAGKLAGRLDHLIKRRLGFAGAVKQQRIARAVPDRPVVQPRVAVGYAPESHPANVLPVLQKNAEQLRITSGQLLLHRLRQTAGVRV